MKKRIFAFLLSTLCLFVCGCTPINTISGDVYTDFSSVSASSYVNFSSNIKSGENKTNENVSSAYESQSSKSNNTISSKNVSGATTSYTTNTKASSFHSSSFKSNANKSSDKTISISSNSKIKLSNIKITNSNKSSFKTVGRCDTGASKGLALSWGGSSIEFFLLCKEEISLNFSFENSPYPVYVRIELDNDDSVYKRLEISSETSVTINTSQSLEKHSIKIIRLSDCESAPLILESISTYGSLVDTPPQNNSLYIEAMGSNNFCGQGLLLDNTQNKYTESEINSPNFADATLTYPYLASKLLKADCYLFARKGAGFIATNLLETQTINNLPQTICNPSGTFIQLYNQINIHNQKESVPQRMPDILVIDAGILDSQLQLLKYVYFNNQLGISQKQAISITANFLSALKSDNPKLKIIWCYGMTSTNENYINFVKKVTDIIDNNSDFVYTLCLPKANNPNFPTPDEHNTAAKLLYQKIKNIIS